MSDPFRVPIESMVAAEVFFVTSERARHGKHDLFTMAEEIIASPGYGQNQPLYADVMEGLNGLEIEIEPPAVSPWHPHPRQLERFMTGKLPKSEAALVIRHLLKGCPQCVQVTRRLWYLGGQV